MKHFENNTMKKLTQSREAFRKANENLNEAMSMLSSGPASYYFDKFFGYAQGLFERFAPLKVGDLAVCTTDRIVKEIESRPHDHGWRNAKHVLSPGRAAIVRGLDFDAKQLIFTYSIEPLKQTHIFVQYGDFGETLVHCDVDRPYVYSMHEGDYITLNGREDQLSESRYSYDTANMIWTSGNKDYKEVSTHEEFNSEDIFFVDVDNVIHRIRQIY